MEKGFLIWLYTHISPPCVFIFFSHLRALIKKPAKTHERAPRKAFRMQRNLKINWLLYFCFISRKPLFEPKETGLNNNIVSVYIKYSSACVYRTERGALRETDEEWNLVLLIFSPFISPISTQLNIFSLFVSMCWNIARPHIISFAKLAFEKMTKSRREALKSRESKNRKKNLRERETRRLFSRLQLK